MNKSSLIEDIAKLRRNFAIELTNQFCDELNLSVPSFTFMDAKGQLWILDRTTSQQKVSIYSQNGDPIETIIQDPLHEKPFQDLHLAMGDNMAILWDNANKKLYCYSLEFTLLKSMFLPHEASTIAHTHDGIYYLVNSNDKNISKCQEVKSNQLQILRNQVLELPRNRENFFSYEIIDKNCFANLFNDLIFFLKEFALYGDNTLCENVVTLLGDFLNTEKKANDWFLWALKFLNELLPIFDPIYKYAIKKVSKFSHEGSFLSNGFVNVKEEGETNLLFSYFNKAVSKKATYRPFILKFSKNKLLCSGHWAEYSTALVELDTESLDIKSTYHFSQPFSNFELDSKGNYYLCSHQSGRFFKYSSECELIFNTCYLAGEALRGPVWLTVNRSKKDGFILTDRTKKKLFFLEVS